MKKANIIIGIIGAAFVFLLIIGNSIVKAQETPLSRGMRSDEVRAIQEVLMGDSTIYPEGYTTGYFGPLTEQAIKRLQERFSVPETGQIDSDTMGIIFPNLTVKVLSPNGGEVLERNEIQTISWSVAVPSGKELMPEEKYFRPQASIDLFREIEIRPVCQVGEGCAPLVRKKVFVKHIATVNLFDMVYSWKITKDIPNGKDYLIRISVGRGIVPIIRTEREKIQSIEPQEIWPVSPGPGTLPYYIYWDESDGTFEIKGQIQPEPLPLTEVIKILESIMIELQKAIALLKEMNR